jgi:hypothetical protein
MFFVLQVFCQAAIYAFKVPHSIPQQDLAVLYFCPIGRFNPYVSVSEQIFPIPYERASRSEV